MAESKLAIDGGIKAIDGFEGKGKPKIGHEEFLEMAGMSPIAVSFANHIIRQRTEHGPRVVWWASAGSLAIWLVIMVVVLWGAPSIASRLQAESVNVSYLDDNLILEARVTPVTN